MLSSQDIVHSKLFILASGSEIRKKILSSHGFNFSVKKSGVDEEELKETIQFLPFEEQVIKLASAKAKEVSKVHPNNYVVGADQMCVCDDTVFNKPGNVQNAINNLSFLSGKTHFQYSGISIFLKEKPLWTFCDIASLKMKNLSKKEIVSYIHQDEPYESCGSYRYESLGANLFSEVEGSVYTIQGLAVNPLMKAFKNLGVSFKQ